MRLVDPVLGVLDLDAPSARGVIGNLEIDRGSPEAREVADVRVNANGTDDQTVFYGASSVALSFDVHDPDGVGPILDLLRALAAPGRRPVLYFTPSGQVSERRVRLRGVQFGAPLTRGDLARVQVQWKVPDGIVESAVEQVVVVRAVGLFEPGRSYPRSYPLAYPPASAGTPVTNVGTEPAAPVFRLWGPCTDPSILDVESGSRVSFTGLSLTAEQYVEVDVREVTALLNGRPDESVLGSVDFLASSFWWLGPGTTQVRYEPATASTGAHADILWRHAWL